MFDKRNLKLDLFALGLFAFTLFAGVALATYDPADPIPDWIAPFNQLHQPDRLVYPLHERVHNRCGFWGAVTADVMLTKLGVGAYFLVGSLIGLDYLLLRRQAIDAPAMRGVGWLLALFGLTSFFALAWPNLSPGPVIGSGGYLGALGAVLLRQHFALAGSLILSTSLFAGGLLLCTDYALWAIGHRSACAAMSVARRRRREKIATDTADGARKVLRKSDAAADLAAAIAAEEASDSRADGDPAIRIRGKQLDVSVVNEDELAAHGDGDSDSNADVDADDWDDEDEQDSADDDDASGNGADGDQRKSRRSLREMIVQGVKTTTRADDAEPAPSPRLRVKKKKKQENTAAREEMIASLNQVDEIEDPADYELPAIDLLIEGDDVCFEEQAVEVRRKAKILEKTFADFGFQVKVVEIETGPVIAQYEVELEAGLRLSRITGLADDLAIALRVPSVRIVAPIPGKNTVGIEVPNETRQIVRLREVIEESSTQIAKMRIPIFLGKDVSGNPLTVDLSTLPHLLIAGRTGTGKSVCLNAIISSILMTRRPDEVRMLMIDPKMVELSCYGKLPHLMHPVVTDMRKAEAILAWAVEKMEERYALLARAGVRHISSYNQLGREELIERLEPENDEEAALIPDQLPFIVIVADEMADLMMTAGKEVEQHIIRLAQKSRAVGIHLILATQKPTVDVITGLIKSNLPARIAFQVASRTDSRVVLDEMGADKLLGNGDMLFLWPGTSTLLRGQGTYLSDDEINSIVGAVSQHGQSFVHELVNMKVSDPSGEKVGPGEFNKRDELYEGAIDIVVREGRGSVSLLQRSLGIGYGRAARLIDFMAEDGIVGPYAGSQAREVIITAADWRRMQGFTDEEEEDESDARPAPARRNRIRLNDTRRSPNDPDAGAEIDEVESMDDDDRPSQVVDEWSDDVDEMDDDESNGSDADDGEIDVDDEGFDEDSEFDSPDEDDSHAFDDERDDDEFDADEDLKSDTDTDEDGDSWEAPPHFTRRNGRNSRQSRGARRLRR